jgi:hypothetical protein
MCLQVQKGIREIVALDCDSVRSERLCLGLRFETRGFSPSSQWILSGDNLELELTRNTLDMSLNM